MSTPRCIDLPRWMDSLADELKKLPLMYIAIPGSHDSMTYDLTHDVAIDSKMIRCLKRCVPEKLKDIFPWMRTQYAPITDQLEHGIRYFDLRVSSKDGVLHFSNGFFAGLVYAELELIKKFLEENVNEVVILDFHHFHFRQQYERKNHKNLINIITDVFGPMICPPQESFLHITLDYLNNQHLQVIVIYRNDEFGKRGNFWCQQDFLTEWGEHTSIRSLLNFIKTFDRPDDRGFVTHAVLTATDPVILRRLKRSSLMQYSTLPVIENVLPWIFNVIPRPPVPPQETVDEGLDDERVRVNVVIADFVEMNDYYFAKKIIVLNDKLLVELTGEPSK